MGIFDYNCYIRNKNCPLLKSCGQEFTNGYIYAVNKKKNKKILCYYSGYGYATLDDGCIIYDLIWINYCGEEINNNFDKCSYFSCPTCAEIILKEYKNWNNFYDKLDSIDDWNEL
jgi:hypothetical protein